MRRHAILRALVVVLAAFALVGGFRPVSERVRPTTDVVRAGLQIVHRALAQQIDSVPRTIVTTEHPDRLWFTQDLYDVLKEASRVQQLRESVDTLYVVYNDVSTRYENAESADSVRRIIHVDISARLVSAGRTTVLSLPVLSDTVVCTRAEAQAAESSQHRCTAGLIPSPQSTLWDDILEPAIFITAAVATVVLLFTVRSQ